MAKIKSVKQFKERVDGAYETMKTRDEAKACYDFAREEFKNAEDELCAYAAAKREASARRMQCCSVRGHYRPMHGRVGGTLSHPRSA